LTRFLTRAGQLIDMLSGSARSRPVLNGRPVYNPVERLTIRL